MKQILRRTARWLAAKPVIGRFVRIGIAFIRLPQAYHRNQIFLTQQVPQLLETVAALNSRQTRIDLDQESLLKSAPMALRELKRDVAALRQAVQSLQAASVPERTVQSDQCIRRARTSGVRLWFGDSIPPDPNFLRVDASPASGADVIASPGQLPFESHEVLEIHALHFLEGLETQRLREVVLPHWHALLASGGLLRIVVGDADAAVMAYAQGRINLAELRDLILGSETSRPAARRNLYSQASLSLLLAEAGFTDITSVAVSAPVHGPAVLEFTARKKDAQ